MIKIAREYEVRVVASALVRPPLNYYTAMKPVGSTPMPNEGQKRFVKSALRTDEGQFQE